MDLIGIDYCFGGDHHHWRCAFLKNCWCEDMPMVGSGFALILHSRRLCQWMRSTCRLLDKKWIHFVEVCDFAGWNCENRAERWWVDFSFNVIQLVWTVFEFLYFYVGFFLVIKGVLLILRCLVSIMFYSITLFCWFKISNLTLRLSYHGFERHFCGSLKFNTGLQNLQNRSVWYEICSVNLFGRKQIAIFYRNNPEIVTVGSPALFQVESIILWIIDRFGVEFPLNYTLNTVHLHLSFFQNLRNNTNYVVMWYFW